MSRDYPDNGYPSVTGILAVLRKIGLEMWFKFNTAQFCNEESNKGKLVGSEIHDVIHQYIETGEAKIESEYGIEVETALNSFMLFKKENPMSLDLAELSLTSEMHQFNGTIDCIAGDIILDWKTGKCKDKTNPPIYNEYKYQVAAYVYLYNEVKKSNIEKAVIVAIAKDKVAYTKYEMGKQEIESCFYEVFLSALRILNYENKQKQLEKEKRNVLRT